GALRIGLEARGEILDAFPQRNRECGVPEDGALIADIHAHHVRAVRNIVQVGVERERRFAKVARNAVERAEILGDFRLDRRLAGCARGGASGRRRSGRGATTGRCSAIDGAKICSSRIVCGLAESTTTRSVRSTRDAAYSAASVHGRSLSSDRPLANRRRSSPFRPALLASAICVSSASICAFRSPCGFTVFLRVLYCTRTDARLVSACGNAAAGTSVQSAAASQRRTFIGDLQAGMVTDQE